MTNAPTRYLQLAHSMEAAPHGEWVQWVDHRAAVAELVEGLREMAQAWGNALELDIIAERHRTTAGVLRDKARDLIAKHGEPK